MSLMLDTPERLARFLMLATDGDSDEVAVARSIRASFPDVAMDDALKLAREAAIYTQRVDAEERKLLDTEAIREEHSA